MQWLLKSNAGNDTSWLGVGPPLSYSELRFSRPLRGLLLLLPHVRSTHYGLIALPPKKVVITLACFQRSDNSSKCFRSESSFETGEEEGLWSLSPSPHTHTLPFFSTAIRGLVRRWERSRRGLRRLQRQESDRGWLSLQHVD